MTLRVECGFCRAGFEVDELHAGRRVRCPACKRIVRVPRVPPLAPSAEPAPTGEEAARKAPESPAVYQVDEPRGPKPPPAPEAPAEKAQAKPDPAAAARARLVDVLAGVLAVSAALAIWDCMRAVAEAVAPSAGWGVRDVVGALRGWGGSFVPRLARLGPSAGKPITPVDQVIVAGILALLALRAMYRSVLLEEGYASPEGVRHRGLGGLVFHFCALLMLTALVACAAAALRRGDAELTAWLMSCFLLAGMASLAAMRLISFIHGNAVTGRMFNDAIFGCAAALVVFTGGIPNAPFGVLEQCAVLVLANGVVGLAISSSVFERGASGRVAKSLGFSALAVIIIVAVALLFATTGPAP